METPTFITVKGGIAAIRTRIFDQLERPVTNVVKMRIDILPGDLLCVTMIAEQPGGEPLEAEFVQRRYLVTDLRIEAELMKEANDDATL